MRWTTILMIGATACAGLPRGAPETRIQAEEVRTVPVTTSSDRARALFGVGRTAEENFRIAAAISSYREALEYDPFFLQAMARLGFLTPGSEGLALARDASGSADLLPDPERLVIASLRAYKEGHQAEGDRLIAQAAEIAPDDWRMQQQVGLIRYRDGDYAGAREALERATSLHLTAGPAWNVLGYTHAIMGDTDAAVAAFEWYAALNPLEANPHDSKGETLLWAGRFADAEQAFLTAVQTDPAFYQGWFGAAQTRFLRGDWEGGQEALDEGLAAAPRETDRQPYYTNTAWRHVAQGNRDAAMAALSQASEEAWNFELHGAYAFGSIWQGQMLLALEDPTGAHAAFTDALARGEEVKLDGGVAATLQAMAEIGLGLAEASTGQLDAARARLPRFDAHVEQLPSLAPLAHRARARLAMAEGTPDAALKALEACDRLDVTCRLDLARILQETDRVADAEAMFSELRGLNRRDAAYLPVWVAAGGPDHVTTAATDPWTR